MPNAFIARVRALSPSLSRKHNPPTSQPSSLPRTSTRKYWESRLSTVQSLPSFNLTENKHPSSQQSATLHSMENVLNESSNTPSREPRRSRLHRIASLPISLSRSNSSTLAPNININNNINNRPISQQTPLHPMENVPANTPRSRRSFRKSRGSKLLSVKSLPSPNFSTPNKGPNPRQSLENESSSTQNTPLSRRSSLKGGGSKLHTVTSMPPSSISTSRSYAASPKTGTLSWHTESSPSKKRSLPVLRYHRPSRKSRLPYAQSLSPPTFPVSNPLPSKPTKRPSSQETSVDLPESESSTSPISNTNTGAPQSLRLPPRVSRVPKVHSLPPSNVPNIKRTAPKQSPCSPVKDYVPLLESVSEFSEDPEDPIMHDLLPSPEKHGVHHGSMSGYEHSETLPGQANNGSSAQCDEDKVSTFLLPIPTPNGPVAPKSKNPDNSCTTTHPASAASHLHRVNSLPPKLVPETAPQSAVISRRKRKPESAQKSSIPVASARATLSLPSIGNADQKLSSPEASLAPISSPISWNRRVFSLPRSVLYSPSRAPPLSEATSYQQIVLPSEVPHGNSKRPPARTKSPAPPPAQTTVGAVSSPTKRRLRSFNRRLFNRSADIAELELFPLEKARVYVQAAEAAVKVEHLESAELHLRNSHRYYRRAIDDYVDGSANRRVSDSGSCSEVEGMEMEWAECIMLLGIVLERRGHMVEAEDVLKEATRRLVKMEPELALVPMCILKKMFLECGRYKEARRLRIYDRNGKVRMVPSP